jgi:VanZ family protein
MFLLLDRAERPRPVTYAITCLAGVILASLMQILQAFMPTRVTSITDAMANMLGTAGGAALGHLRKELRLRFE